MLPLDDDAHGALWITSLSIFSVTPDLVTAFHHNVCGLVGYKYLHKLWHSNRLTIELSKVS